MALNRLPTLIKWTASPNKCPPPSILRCKGKPQAAQPCEPCPPLPFCLPFWPTLQSPILCFLLLKQSPPRTLCAYSLTLFLGLPLFMGSRNSKWDAEGQKAGAENARIITGGLPMLNASSKFQAHCQEEWSKDVS